jgi:hypothetical protein
MCNCAATKLSLRPKQTQILIFNLKSVLSGLANYASKKKKFEQSFEQTPKRNLYIKDCIFVSGKLFCDKTLNHIASVYPAQIEQPGEQTQNAIFTLKIAFSSLTNYDALRFESHRISVLNSNSATIQTNTKHNLYIKDCSRANNVELR